MSKWGWPANKEETKTVMSKEVVFDLGNRDATKVALLDLATEIGQGAKPMSFWSITSRVLRDASGPWVDVMCDSHDNDTNIPDLIGGLVAAYATLIAAAIVPTCRPDHEVQAAEQIADMFRDSLVGQIKCHKISQQEGDFDKLMEEFNARRAKEKMEQR